MYMHKKGKKGLIKLQYIYSTEISVYNGTYPCGVHYNSEIIKERGVCQREKEKERKDKKENKKQNIT